MDVQKALQNQLGNIEKRTGKSLKDLVAVVKKSGLAKHGEIVAMLKSDLGMGHGDANTLTKYALGSLNAHGGDAKSAVDTIYTGAKAELKPIHDAIMAKISKFGEFETSPKKTYLSLRRKKQFAMVGPATNTRIEVGLNMKGVKPTARLVAEKPGGMCQYKVKVTDKKEVDAELVGWIKEAFKQSGE
ncbi:MAG TPA: DUF5655 domain-containing protein [Fimbriimonadaceae bacterium]|nr:DUF5655 domain-containing protein [Fimbriimonadaceae bacterium]